MADEGYILLARRFFEHPLWAEPRRFSKAEAWIDMIAEACFKPRVRLVGNERIPLERGQFVASLRWLAKRWGWDKKAVVSYLKAAERAGEVRSEMETVKGTIYSIVNYETYQKRGDSKGTARGQQGDSKGTKQKEGKEGNKGKEEQHLFEPEFLECWSEYPSRAGGNSKRAAHKAWAARRKEGHEAATLLAGTQRYARYCFEAGSLRSQFVKMASTFYGPDLHFLEAWSSPPPKAGIPPESEAAAGRRNEQPVEPGARSGEFATVGGKRLESDDERDDRRVREWEAANPEAARAVWTECAAATADIGLEAGIFSTVAAKAIIRSKFRQRILQEFLTPRAVA